MHYVYAVTCIQVFFPINCNYRSTFNTEYFSLLQCSNTFKILKMYVTLGSTSRFGCINIYVDVALASGSYINGAFLLNQGT